MDMVLVLFALCVGTFALAIKAVTYINKLGRKNKRNVSIGFFHPYCNAGGGGERVLWTAISAIQKQYKDVHCVVYSGDGVATKTILKTVEQRFNIKLLREIDVINIKSRVLVEAKCYPAFTLLLQSLGSVILAIEALLRYPPDVYIDTMGYAWTLPVFKFLGSCRVAAYVHFPTISTDMLQVVQDRRVAVNNRRFISKSPLFSYFKLIYYRIFAFLYGLVGRQAEVIMVNSSWTRGHILELWKKLHCTFTVYPPCDVHEFNSIPLESHIGKTRILSIAQFRPEKDHELQIRAFHDFLNRLKGDKAPVLVLIGSCRHDEDYQRVENLKNLCVELDVIQQVEFKVNLSFQDIIHEMENASVALHTMRDEHFGIGIVECMSAGLIMIAHNSGGPKMDIVIDYDSKKTGFLAKDIQTFGDALESAWKLNHKDLLEIRKNARKSVSRFSVQNFEEEFLSAMKIILE